MHRLSPDLLQHLWDLRSNGTSLRKVAVQLGISRNTVRRYVRRAVHGSSFPASYETAPAWHARSREILDARPNIRATTLATELRAEGFVVTARSVQRTLAAWRAREADLATRTHSEVIAIAAPVLDMEEEESEPVQSRTG